MATERENTNTFQIADFDAKNVSGDQLRKLPSVSANFQECPQTFKSVHKLSEFLETCQSVQKVHREPTNFPECMETFQRVRKHFIVPVNFPECPETFWSVQNVVKNLEIL